MRWQVDRGREVENKQVVAILLGIEFLAVEWVNVVEEGLQLDEFLVDTRQEVEEVTQLQGFHLTAGIPDHGYRLNWGTNRGLTG